jgi:ATP-dependent helicase/nuclease subunit B
MGGLAGVRFLTLGRLVAELAERDPSLEGKLVLQGAVLAEALRRRLVNAGSGADSSPGLQAIARRPASLCALVDTYRELRRVSDNDLESVAQIGGRLGEVARLVGEVHRGLADAFVDEEDLLEAAMAVLSKKNPALAAHLGRVVVYLPERLTSRQCALVSSLGSAVGAAVIVELTGDEAADAVVYKLGKSLGAPEPEPVPAPKWNADIVVRAHSPDCEVLHVLRSIMELNASGSPFSTMAVAYAIPDPYAELLRSHLERAGVPFNGSEPRSLAATVAGRTLLGALALHLKDWPRGETVDWLASIPLLDPSTGQELPATMWDRVSREAGIVKGLSSWIELLDAYVNLLRCEADRWDQNLGSGADSSPGRVESMRDRAEAAERLASFVISLASRFDEKPSTWQGWSKLCRAILNDYLGNEHERSRWPDEETVAFNSVVNILESLESLDEIPDRIGDKDPGSAMPLEAGESTPPGRQPTMERFFDALSTELDSPAPQTSRFGRGVFVGSIGELSGLSFDHLFIVGMSDEAFGHAGSGDPVLPDSLRKTTNGLLPLRGGVQEVRRRQYLCALANSSWCLVSFAEADLRSGRSLRPSRFWLNALGAVVEADRPLYSGDLESYKTSERYRILSSYAATIMEDREPASISDWDLRSLLRKIGQTGSVCDHFLFEEDDVLSAARSTIDSRSSSCFTRFDGKIDSLGIDPPGKASPVSATSLESLATCPRSYFFSHVLGLEERESPEEVEQVSALDVGNLVHGILKDFLQKYLSGSASGGISCRAWNHTHWDRLEKLAHRRFKELERQNRVGMRAQWAVIKASILRDLKEFLRQDSTLRSQIVSTPEAVELGFGGPDQKVVLDIGGKKVALKGSIDRVDRLGDGRLHVIDYKTGSSQPYERLSEDDPVVGGTKLQLPVYALAAQKLLDGAGAVGTYWFVTRKGGYKRKELQIDGSVVKQAKAAIGTLIDLVERGLFPGNPGPDGQHCRLCSFNDLCPSDRLRQWDAKWRSPLLNNYLALAEPDAGPSRSGGGKCE